MKGDRIMRNSDYVLDVAGTFIVYVCDLALVAGALAAIYMLFV